MQRFTHFFILSLLFLFSCGNSMQRHQYRIGVDPSWYPLNLGSREQAMTAFSTELLTEIGKIEKVAFIKMTVSWDNLMLDLKEKKYEAILSLMPPYLFNSQEFTFSDLYLPMGPVLVVGTQSTIKELKALDGKEVAVIAGSSNDLLLEKIPGVMIRYYDSIPVALNDVMNQTVDAALIDILTATSYCQDLYRSTLKIATPPLNNYGLRLITLYNAAPSMIEVFNRGLEKLKKSGEYDLLLKKWGLIESQPS